MQIFWSITKASNREWEWCLGKGRQRIFGSRSAPRLLLRRKICFLKVKLKHTIHQKYLLFSIMLQYSTLFVHYKLRTYAESIISYVRMSTSTFLLIIFALISGWRIVLSSCYYSISCICWVNMEKPFCTVEELTGQPLIYISRLLHWWKNEVGPLLVSDYVIMSGCPVSSSRCTWSPGYVYIDRFFCRDQSGIVLLPPYLNQLYYLARSPFLLSASIIAWQR